MKALISPNESLRFIDGLTGTRIAQVADEEFPVAEPLFWVDCPEGVSAETHHWTGDGFAINLDPEEIVVPEEERPPTLSTGRIPVEIL